MTQILRSLTPVALVLALAACASAPPREGAVADPSTALDQFEAPVRALPQEIRLAVHAQGVSQGQARALADLVAGWRAAAGGQVVIQSPSGAADSGAVYRMGESVRAFLIGQGVPAQAVQVVGYDGGGPEAPLVVGYLRYEVDVPRCGQQWENLTSTWNNRVYENFGCANTANLAAQIANPADLAGPRASDAPDAQRRMEVLDRYRAGRITSSEKDEQAAGALSTAVK
ncbi:MAG: CpaD family pilus assembly protein [Phenylobacterium sp.]|uniref:CpaD family pilus assembly protein n=1 Tax=Phenylobacterium sp. TaxID=1871053 RepID=UPI00391BDFE5